MDRRDISGRLLALGRKQTELADALGITADKVNKSFSGIRQFTAQEMFKAIEWLDAVESGTGDPDLPANVDDKDYLRVEVLPSFAGMGGGGTGEGDHATGLVSRQLIERELMAQPADLLLIDVRGDSMEPDFQHGDQILIDRRDRDPIQPGPFAILDDGTYHVKLVERVPQRRGWYRVWSANGRYAPTEVDANDLVIMGRPVWFARRL